MTALAYTFWSMTEWPDHYKLVPSAATVFVEQTDIPEDVPFTGAQVVAKLYQLSEDNIPIIVDGFLFRTDEDVRLYQGSVVSLRELYEWVVKVDTDGKVSEISFYRKEV
ncbi:MULTISPECIES: hypothetical protein [unclassified Sporosarcina]|uniref:hypothetical protein n=1 Tax=unclassified Sporosarcina TaxID=2647733 RepID=UPI001A9298C7|nr:MULTISPECIES: hypothetical protein [unclassified Sporosarcina]MBO0589271.1 hypothetical protein [Sporosarcina sp. E16_8]MBO0601978.1 hypothetical protein [Sporosarcina sp. E16_3]